MNPTIRALLIGLILYISQLILVNELRQSYHSIQPHFSNPTPTIVAEGPEFENENDIYVHANTGENTMRTNTTCPSIPSSDIDMNFFDAHVYPLQVRR